MTSPSQHPQNPSEVLIDFQLTLADTNMILQALAQRPYFEVAPLIHEIQRIAQAKVSRQPVGVDVQYDSSSSSTAPVF